MANTIDGMNIGGAASGPGGVVRPAAEGASPAAEGTNPAAQAPQQAGDVQITDSAAQLARLEQTLRALPAVDQSRVDAVSHTIASGGYAIDSGRIAAGLLGSERTLGALPTEEL
ncbi:MAG TPA: flagellar biosynthesis anti-sigma factor FlgM [Steroidobacteraceae bacterium]|jgi:flagellar biosynthesis anti-sigma factor FlgM|nr:flagellar biosynthesis anti-sigma factor FlgM [Steroidobacteraceae bacterium]